MGFNSFPGYEIMILLLALVLYGAIPLGLAAYLYFKGYRHISLSPLRRLVLAPPLSICCLLVFRTVFLFVFSGADMRLVFQWRVQIFISCIVCILFILYDRRTALRKHDVIRWFSTTLAAFLIGAAITVIFFGAVGKVDWFPVGNPSFTYPHSLPAMWATMVGGLFLLILGLIALYKIQPATKYKTGPAVILKKSATILWIAFSYVIGMYPFLFLEQCRSFAIAMAEIIFTY